MSFDFTECFIRTPLNKVAMLPEIRVEMPELSTHDVMTLPSESQMGDESDVENELESLTNENVKLEKDSKPEAREGVDNDSINIVVSDSESPKQSIIKTCSSRQVKLWSKYDGFKMIAAEI